MANMHGWLTTEDAAHLTGYNLEYIRRLVRTKKVQAKKWGRDWMVSQASLTAYMEKAERRGPRGDQKRTKK